MSEDQVIDSLLGNAEMPVDFCKIGRLNLEIDLQGLIADKVYKTREQCTVKKKSKGQTVVDFDEEKFNCLLIAQATTGLRVVVQEEDENTEKKVIVFSGWGDQRFLSKYRLSGPDQVVKRMLLAGELDSLGSIVLDLSGYNTDLEDVKN